MLLRRCWKLSVSLRRYTTHRACSYKSAHFENIEDKKRFFKNTTINANEVSTELKTLLPTRILLILENNQENLDGSHFVIALQSFLKLYKKNLMDMNTPSERTVGWEKQKLHKQVCSLIISNIDRVTGPQCVQILDMLTRLKVSQQSKIMQTVLQRISQTIGELSLSDYCLLSSLIRKFPRSELNNNIRSTLNQKFVVKISMDLETDNIDDLEGAFSFASHNVKEPKILALLINKLQQYKDDMPITTSIRMLESLCTMSHYPDGWLNVLRQVQNDIMNHVDELKDSQINYIILLIAQKMRGTHMEEFYNAVFMDKMVKKIIDDDMGFEVALSALKCLIYIRHLNKELLNYISASYFEKTTLRNLELSDRTGKLLVLIAGLASAGHKTMFWNDIKEYILNDKTMLDYNHKTLCILALNIMCLDSYPYNFLEKIFDGKYDFSRESYLHWTFCKIYQKIKSDPSYNGPLPLESQVQSLELLLQNAHENKEKYAYELLCNLEEGMGGPMYVKSNISTKLFHLIEHVVAFKEDGNPVPLNTATNIEGIPNKFEYIEDLEVPPKSKIIAISHMPYFWYFRNSDELMAIHKTTVDTLQKKYPVVPINGRKWKSIPEKDRTSFLMNEIKLKFNSPL